MQPLAEQSRQCESSRVMWARSCTRNSTVDIRVSKEISG
jgi:hypothetical protein